jgi:gliding motility-associated-like protein
VRLRLVLFFQLPYVRSVLLVAVLIAPVTPSLAQKRCGTVEYNQSLRQSKSVLENEKEFEQWLQERLPKAAPLPEALRKREEPYKVQVVIHVIHRGEAIGQGSNLSEAQILSQLEVLNKDFNRLNDDAANTPTEFQPVAASMNIEFVLATTDPDGLPSSGINRVRGTKSSWTIQDNVELKSLSYWPAENYINIWVCDLLDYYGFTQFPVSSLPGLENSSRNRLTDGIIVSYIVFGSADFGSFNLDPAYNKGRTATHEMGHFFGLRHTWGDVDECGGTDYVDDTPDQSEPTLGCPVHSIPDCPKDNPKNKMFQNYLDFTDDECMNLFTQEQVMRMVTVLENSPRRASLLLPLSLEQPAVQFPKVFSPNGDGVNDFWLWTNTLEYTGCKLSIFNRFGKLVYSMVSYDGSWNGRSSDGQLLEEEAYYYVIACDGKKEITGGVRIIR